MATLPSEQQEELRFRHAWLHAVLDRFGGNQIQERSWISTQFSFLSSLVRRHRVECAPAN
jgi:hypothetical protein